MQFALSQISDKIVLISSAAGIILIVSVVILLLRCRQMKQEAALCLEQFKTAEHDRTLLSVKNVQLLEYIEETKRINQQLQQKLDIGQKNFTTVTNQYIKIKTTLEQREQHFQEQIALLNDSRTQLSLEFNELANRIFDAKGKTFTQQNQQVLHAVLLPFREQIEQFRKKSESIHYEETVQKTRLEEELKQLKQLNAQMAKETQDLTQALTGNKKMQGNWGELILENVLERGGLVLGRDYQQQVHLVAEDGKTQIPDVVINLPGNKHLIVDSKVSMNDYVRAMNTEGDDHEEALRAHIYALSRHIRELSERHYSRAQGVNAPEVVIMFIPIEAAFIDACRFDDQLFQKAVDRNILVATPTTLLASLNIVRQLWRLEKQTASTLRLTELAARVYDKLRAFISSMDEIEKSLDKAQESYRNARNQLVDGRGNLIKLSDDFLALGICVKAEIDEKTRERGQMELSVEHEHARNSAVPN